MIKIPATAIAIYLAITASVMASLVPATSRHYESSEYQFSVEVPRGLLACVSDATDHGIDILLDHNLRCDSDYEDQPYVDVSANYNAAGEADTSTGLAKIFCEDKEARRIIWLKGWTLGGRAAAGCRQYFNNNLIRIQLIALRETDPRNPEVWIMIGADLTTTTSRYRRDMHVFRDVVRAVRIGPDGPLK